MAIYNEIGSGGCKNVGCAVITYTRTYTTLFAAGDIVFYVDKARKGVLEKIVIKKPRVINAAKTGGRFEVMYVDTFNALWNEWDLVSHRDALALAEEYYQDMLQEAAKLKKC